MLQAAPYLPLQKTQGRGTHFTGAVSSVKARPTRPELRSGEAFGAKQGSSVSETSSVPPFHTTKTAVWANAPHSRP
jgi:hypothetical protein